MRGRMVLTIVLVALTGPAAAARAAGDPTMPMSEVRQGMQCTGYSVVRGTSVESFDVEILDVVGGETGARLLVRASGPAVDRTGIGAGFSGSPIYCPDDAGTMKNAGAISETIGDYEGKVVLATPIEQILGTPLDAPTAAEDRPGATARVSQRDRAVLARARPLASPLTIGGLSRPLFRGLAAAAARHGVHVVQAPPAPLQAPSFEPLRPGSAMGVGLSSGDVSIGAIGTVAYVDGDGVWSFGHGFDSVGRRSLLLQSAYVATVVNNPVQTADGGGSYKLAGAVDDIGTLTNDGFNAVAGRTGPLPATIPVRVFARDADTGREVTTTALAADETDIGTPTGASPLSFVAPLAVSQAATEVFGSQPARVAGEMCLRIAVRERKRAMRFCNRYVADGTSGDAVYGNAVALSAATDAADALALLDGFKARGLHVTEVAARVTMTRGQRQAYMRRITLPRRVRAGQRVRAKLVVQRVRGARETLRFAMRIPARLRPGLRTLTFRGREPEVGDEFFGELTISLGGGGDSDPEGPRTLGALADAVRGLQRRDGVRLRGAGEVFRHPVLRIGGRETATVRVTR